MTFGFIHAEKARYPIRVLCRALAVSPSGDYGWRSRPVVESFFSTLKSELAMRRWPTRRAAAMALGPYIDGFYNATRLHFDPRLSGPGRV